jgi:glutathione reductase (NADPH)
VKHISQLLFVLRKQVPKKVMWNAASIMETVHDMHHYGFDGSVTFDWRYLKETRDKYVERLNGIYDRNLENANIDKMVGVASLEGPNTVRFTPTNNGSHDEQQPRTVTAQHILIATGGKPYLPDIEGIKEHAITSDEFFDLEEQPRKAVVVGAGYVACELAGILQALGSETKLVIRFEKVLRNFDDLLSDTLEEEMERQGIEIFRNSKGVAKIVNDGNNNHTKTVYLKNGETIRGVDTVMIAPGRSPNVDKLNLEAVGIKQNRGGYIESNEFSETNMDGVYALGDVCGIVELTPTAIAAGRRLADRLFGGPEFADAKISYHLVPTVVFTHPTIGTIGLTEKQARKKYGDENVRVYQSKFANLYYGPWHVEPDDKPKTAMKLVCAGKNELIVGLHVIGRGADEMLQGFGVALKMVSCFWMPLLRCDVYRHPSLKLSSSQLFSGGDQS